MALRDLRRRLERLDNPQRTSGGEVWGVDPEYCREQAQAWPLAIARRAVELRRARERGEELSDPHERATTAAEQWAHLVSHAHDSVDDVPDDLMASMERRIVGEPHEELRRVKIAIVSAALDAFRELWKGEQQEREE